jgi:hypothetical protein
MDRVDHKLVLILGKAAVQCAALCLGAIAKIGVSPSRLIPSQFSEKTLSYGCHGL